MTARTTLESTATYLLITDNNTVGWVEVGAEFVQIYPVKVKLLHSICLQFLTQNKRVG